MLEVVRPLVDRWNMPWSSATPAEQIPKNRPDHPVIKGKSMQALTAGYVLQYKVTHVP